MLERDFSHVPNFTDYMVLVEGLVLAGQPHQRILDIPAGQGLLAARLREHGHEVVCGDINRAQPDYVYADLNERLPFPDGDFDTCLCTEGVEHVIDSAALIQELCRVTRCGGRLIVSLPNIQNAYSRFMFLCTGYYYQFEPGMSRHLAPGEMIDRGHIAPLSYLQLRYLFRHHGARVVGVAGDRWKKKWLVPLLLPFLGLGWVWARVQLASKPKAPKAECREILRHLFSPPLLFGRSLVLTFEKD